MSQFFVISAPSGTGKTTLVKKIVAEVPDCCRSVSATTRPPRRGEREGVDYRFVDGATFREMILRGEFFEWQEVHGFLYGTAHKVLQEAQRTGVDLLLDIDTRGALAIKQAYSGSCLIFLKPPTWETLVERLKGRKTEEAESLQRRLEAAKRELEEQKKFDYVIINDRLDKTIEEVKQVIERERQVRRDKKLVPPQPGPKGR